MATDGLCDRVRRRCAAIAASARFVRIHPGSDFIAGGVTGLDPELHPLEAPAEELARYVLVLDAINFGSGWFPTLRIEGGASATDAFTRCLTEHARRRGGTWTAAELRAVGPPAVAELLDQSPRHDLMGLYARGLNQLGDWLGDRRALEAIGEATGSAERFAEALASGMSYYDDHGFYKRAQITANDLALAGVVEFTDVDRLTSFADNMVPHVLRVEGILEYAPELAAAVDAGHELPAGGKMEREIRACAVHACELLARRLDVPPRTLDNWLWNRGQRPPYTERLPHLTRTVYY
ncbi:MAG: queuosine salvage family protein [Solirubrobacteraceae bacterium]